MIKGKTYPHLRRARIGNCSVCSKEFRAVGDFSGENYTREQKYCSKECWSNRSPKQMRNCKLCGKEFKAYKSVRKSYCSPNCRNEHYKTLQKGDRSHFWKGGRTKESKLARSSSDYKRWRKSVYERDLFKCKLCDEKGYLHPHHIIEFAIDPSKRFDVDNGMTLCATCHSIVHSKRFARSKQEKLRDEKYCDVIVKRYIDFCKKNKRSYSVRRNGEDCLKEFENDKS